MNCLMIRFLLKLSVVDGLSVILTLQCPFALVDAEQFLALCLKYFPTSTLSPGFTTGVPDSPDQRFLNFAHQTLCSTVLLHCLNFRMYTTSQVEQMKSVLEKSGAIGHRITYPVRAILVGK